MVEPATTTSSSQSTPESFSTEASQSGHYIGRLEPTDNNAPKFDGDNITDFLEEYNFEANRVRWDENTRKRQLPYFCTQRYKAFVRKLPSYGDQSVSWAAYQTELKNLYASQDENRKRGTRAFLENYVQEVHRRQPSVRLVEYYQNFITYFAAAEARGQVIAIEKGRFFFRGLAREDMNRVIEIMPKEDRPTLEDLGSFKIEKIYEFVREYQEQEDGLNALNTDYSAASRVLARRDAAGLEEAVPAMIDLQSPTVPQAGILPIAISPKPVVPKIDPIDELCQKFGGLTFTTEQFEYLSKSSLAVQRLLSDPIKWAEAYRRLVLQEIV